MVVYLGGTVMNQQPQKRKNPFETTFEEPKVVETENVGVEEEIVEEEHFFAQQPRYQQPQQIKKAPKVVQRQQYQVQDDANREKYTSTMDIQLRRQIKIACAERGIMFAKFVEDACREKLNKEGFRGNR